MDRSDYVCTNNNKTLIICKIWYNFFSIIHSRLKNISYLILPENVLKLRMLVWKWNLLEIKNKHITHMWHFQVHLCFWMLKPFKQTLKKMA